MSEFEEPLDSEPPEVQPYEELDVARTATADEIKAAYRKAALQNHPDKVPASRKEEAHEAFQRIALAYAVLSDPVRRKRYDATGSTAESIVDSEGFNWSDYYREQFKDTINAEAIEKFAKKYKGSDEEKDDVLIAYEQYEGDMDGVYETVTLSNVLEDDERFRAIINKAIRDQDVPNFKAYARESKTRREARVKQAREEAKEAEDYAKELGVHDDIFGGKKGKKSKESSEDGLAALIQRRQQDRSESFFDHLEAKYGGGSGGGKKKKGKKRDAEEEPSEEAFQAAAAKLNNAKKHRS